MTTRGSGAYKLSGITVYAFASSAEEAWNYARSGPVELPRALARAKTDADGKFKLKAPKGQEYFLFAQGQRLLPDGHTERLEWRMPASDFRKGESVLLDNARLFRWRAVKIEETP